jgi:hypothetical protein
LRVSCSTKLQPLKEPTSQRRCHAKRSPAERTTVLYSTPSPSSIDACTRRLTVATRQREVAIRHDLYQAELGGRGVYRIERSTRRGDWQIQRILISALCLPSHRHCLLPCAAESRRGCRGSLFQQTRYMTTVARNPPDPAPESCDT